jgi:hypothetical protein
MDFIILFQCGKFIHSNKARMDKRGYDVKLAYQLWTYEFYSEGPKGKIKKVIQFTPYKADGQTCFNLCFGDWCEEKGIVDDLTISDNKDSIKVLSTVARSVMAFTDIYPDALIYVKGSTRSRTRLYQMGITKNWVEISQLFTVFGYTNDNKWQLYLKNVNYEAFMVLRKNYVNLY